MISCWAAAPAAAQQGTLLISELLYQPRSGEAEYVELYNSSDASVDLAAYHIVRWVGDSLGKHYPLPSYTVGSHDYVVLTKDAASVEACFTVRYKEKLMECSLPTYPNSGGSVILTSADSLIVDRFDYQPSMHSRMLRDKAGVSLERRSFERPTSEAANWFSAASTAGFGTPTAPNSQSDERLALNSDFELSSTLFSPDGDGYQDELEISYRLDASDLVGDVDLYNAAGQRVRRVLGNALMGAAGTLRWDGLDDHGTRCTSGRYLLIIKLYNTGSTVQTLRRTVSIRY